MFDEDDDFEIDEEFLDGVFDAEKSAIKSNVTLETTCHSPDNSLVGDLDSSPARKRKTLSPHPSATSPVQQRITPTPVLRTNEESARLVATAGQRRALTERINTDSENALEPGFQECNIKGSGVNNWNQVNRPSNTVFKLPPDKIPSPINRAPPKSNLNTETSFTLNTSRTRQRKFPGPAGLLPDRGRSHVQGQRANFSSLLDTSEDDDESEEPLSLCSQSSASVLEDGPWSSLQSDFEGEGQGLLRHYTVAWVKQKAAARQLLGQKIPFLAAVLHSIDCSSPDPCVVLRDATGEIPGTLHRSVWDSFGGQLIAGSALVLRFVGVLSTGISTRRHYLNITSNNIVTIYSSPLCESSVPDTSMRVRKTEVHKWTLNQLLQGANSWEEQSKRKKSTGPSLVIRNGGGSTVSSASLNSHSSAIRPQLQASSTSSDVPVNSLSIPATRLPLQACSRSGNSSGNPPSTSTLPSFRRPPPAQATSNKFLNTASTNVGANSSNNHSTSIRPQVPNANSSTVQVKSNPSLPQTSLQATGPNQSASNSIPIAQQAQTRFVPKRPSLSFRGLDKTDSGAQNKPSSSSLNCSVPSQGNRVDLQSSRDLFSDADDIDISSVLDGIDSESLFGDF